MSKVFWKTGEYNSRKFKRIVCVVYFGQ